MDGARPRGGGGGSLQASASLSLRPLPSAMPGAVRPPPLEAAAARAASRAGAVPPSLPRAHRHGGGAAAGRRGPAPRAGAAEGTPRAGRHHGRRRRRPRRCPPASRSTAWPPPCRCRCWRALRPPPRGATMTPSEELLTHRVRPARPYPLLPVDGDRPRARQFRPDRQGQRRGRPAAAIRCRRGAPYGVGGVTHRRCGSLLLRGRGHGGSPPRPTNESPRLRARSCSRRRPACRSGSGRLAGAPHGLAHPMRRRWWAGPAGAARVTARTACRSPFATASARVRRGQGGGLRPVGERGGRLGGPPPVDVRGAARRHAHRRIVWRRRGGGGLAPQRPHLSPPRARRRRSSLRRTCGATGGPAGRGRWRWRRGCGRWACRGSTWWCLSSRGRGWWRCCLQVVAYTPIGPTRCRSRPAQRRRPSVAGPCSGWSSASTGPCGGRTGLGGSGRNRDLAGAGASRRGGQTVGVDAAVGGRPGRPRGPMGLWWPPVRRVGEVPRPARQLAGGTR